MTLQNYLAILSRRKWLVIVLAIGIPLTAVFLESRRADAFSASADVLITNDTAANLVGTGAGADALTADRYAATQASLARTPDLVRRTLRAAGERNWDVRTFLQNSSVVAVPNQDLLRFSVTAPTPTLARKLATAYARQFPIYRRTLDEAALGRATIEVQERINALRAAGDTSSSLYDTLVAKRQQLAALGALQTTSAQLVQAAEEATQVQPRPVRSAVLGIFLGLLVALVVAFAADALDTRIRSIDEIEAALGIPLLARLPAPPADLRQSGSVATLKEPQHESVEAFRMLRTNLEFINLDRKARSIMVTSGLESEGKSTTSANLAVLLAQSGKSVALVDCDLRRPSIAQLLDLRAHIGLTEVARGTATLERALQTVELPEVVETLRRPVRSRLPGGTLSVLVAGMLPPNPGEFVGSHAVGVILRSLRERHDFVIIDTPPVIRVGDALALSKHVDGVLLVLRRNVTRRQTLRDVRRAMDTCPAAELGFVVTDDRMSDVPYTPYAYPAEPLPSAGRQRSAV